MSGTGGPALVLLIVTTADGCCCASNGRAVFALFCPKKHGRRKFGKSKTREAHLEADGLPSRCFRKHRNGDKTHKFERWFWSDNTASPSENPSNSLFLPAHNRWLKMHNLDTWWGRFPPDSCDWTTTCRTVSKSQLKEQVCEMLTRRFHRLPEVGDGVAC